jgi:hypothetical protein
MFEWVATHWDHALAVLDRAHDRVAFNIERAKQKRHGNKLAIVGPPKAGKTVVHVFLETGVLITDYNPTLGASRVQPSRTTIEAMGARRAKNPISLYLAERPDVSGNFGQFGASWREALNDAFFVLFLFDASIFLGMTQAATTYRRDVVAACEFAGSLIRYRDTKVVLGGTHCDLIDGWPASHVASRILRSFGKHDEFDQAIAQIGKNVKEEPYFVIGSLKDETNATELLYSIFETADW